MRIAKAANSGATADVLLHYDFHPLAAVFPLLEGEEFEELVASIAANGQRDPITLYREQILDGRNRFRACIKAGVVPVFEILPDGQDLLRFVVDRNLRRRHL